MPVITRVDLLQKRRTKIIATLGPASSELEQIRVLVHAGVDLFRQNMSHGDHDYHSETYSRVRQVAEELGRPIAVLADLCGPKIRVGRFKSGRIELNTNDTVVVTTRDIEGGPGLIPSQYQALHKDVKPGDRILLADGLLELEVGKIRGTEIICGVICGGTLSNHKGINLPGVRVSAPSLTDKDKTDAQLAIKLGVDFIALSFVRTTSDIAALRKFLKENNSDAWIIAKIEKPEALDEIDTILDISDGIMIARGDLGIELNLEQVPVIQHQLIDLARKKFKPVIVATQMLESMIENVRPTRAEATDVAYAVTLDADAIMLSGETAVGAFPVDAVKMMDRIARQIESYLSSCHTYNTNLAGDITDDALSIWDAVGNAMARLAQDLKVHAVVVISQSGMSAATMSSVRPAAPVIAITDRFDICRKMVMLWGVLPVYSEEAGCISPEVLARKITVRETLAQAGDKVLLVRGFHGESHLNVPSVTVLTI